MNPMLTCYEVHKKKDPMAYVHPKLKRSAFELSYTPILHPVESL